jgi:hypothetical protein
LLLAALTTNLSYGATKPDLITVIVDDLGIGDAGFTSDSETGEGGHRSVCNVWRWKCPLPPPSHVLPMHPTRPLLAEHRRPGTIGSCPLVVLRAIGVHANAGRIAHWALPHEDGNAGLCHQADGTKCAPIVVHTLAAVPETGRSAFEQAGHLLRILTL